MHWPFERSSASIDWKVRLTRSDCRATEIFKRDLYIILMNFSSNSWKFALRMAKLIRERLTSEWDDWQLIRLGGSAARTIVNHRTIFPSVPCQNDVHIHTYIHTICILTARPVANMSKLYVVRLSVVGGAKWHLRDHEIYQGQCAGPLHAIICWALDSF